MASRWSDGGLADPPIGDQKTWTWGRSSPTLPTGMRLATLKDGTRDGALAVVSTDGKRVLRPADGPATMQGALDDWPAAIATLRDATTALEEGTRSGESADPSRFDSPLPRAYQWAEASAYHSHMERLRAARGVELPPDHGAEPAAYNGGSDSFLRPTEPIPLADPDWELDIEATIAVITDDVPIGTTAEDAAGYIRLVVLLNDLTFRSLMWKEYARSIGFYQAKPERSLAPFAATPEFLGDAWDGRLLSAELVCSINGEPLGRLDTGVGCVFDFTRVIAHLTRTRPLAAGSIIGNGTVSNRDPEAGFGVIEEKRAVELAETGEAKTRYLIPGDRIKMEAFDRTGRSLFGAMDQEVVAA